MKPPKNVLWSKLGPNRPKSVPKLGFPEFSFRNLFYSNIVGLAVKFDCFYKEQLQKF